MASFFCFFTQILQIRYSSQSSFENPTANLSALCNSCAKIAFCSFELIFTFLNLWRRNYYFFFNFRTPCI